MNIPETINGNIIIVCKEDKSFKSLTKKQATEYVFFLRNCSFNYDNDNNVHSKYMNNVYSNNLKKDISLINQNEEILKMILNIQRIILKFIKNYMN